MPSVGEGGVLLEKTMSSNEIKVMFWPNSTRSLKVDGKMADWTGDYSGYGLGLLTASDLGTNGIRIQSSRLGPTDASLVVTSDIPHARKHTSRSPDYSGIVEVPETGTFRVVAWKRYKTNGDPFLSAFFEPHTVTARPANSGVADTALALV
jgi:hypothetical protein